MHTIAFCIAFGFRVFFGFAFWASHFGFCVFFGFLDLGFWSLGFHILDMAPNFSNRSSNRLALTNFLEVTKLLEVIKPLTVQALRMVEVPILWGQTLFKLWWLTLAWTWMRVKRTGSSHIWWTKSRSWGWLCCPKSILISLVGWVGVTKNLNCLQKAVDPSKSKIWRRSMRTGTAVFQVLRDLVALGLVGMNLWKPS